MVIEVSKLLKTDGASLPVQGEVLLADQPFGCLDVRFDGPVLVTGKVTNIGGTLYLEARVEVSYRTCCARCLREVAMHQVVDIQEAFSASAGLDDADERLPLSHDCIDVDDILEQSLFGALPTKVLCKEDCKGLCPVCGCDRNETVCDCQQEDIDPRLAVLKDFLKD